MKKIKVEESLLEEKIRKSNEKLGSTLYKFYERLNNADREFAGREGALTFYSGTAVERFLGTASAVRKTLEDLYPSGLNLDDTNTFLNSYSLYVASSACIEDMKERTGLDPGVSDKAAIDFSENGYTLIYKTLIENYLVGLANSAPKNGEEILELTGKYLRWVQREALKNQTSQRFSKLQETIKNHSVEVLQLVFNGSSYRPATGRNTKKEREKLSGQEEAGGNLDEIQQPIDQNLDYGISLDDIVGNNELKKELKKAVENILCYNPGKKENILKKYCDFPQKFLVVGGEGTGKTTTIKAILSYGSKIAKENNIPLKFIEISSSFRTKWYGESSNNLKQLLSPVNSGDSAYIISIEDIDTVLFSRDDDVHHEDLAILGVLMNFIEGVGTASYGNYILVATTNKMLNLDSALAGRLKENTIVSTGPECPEDYAKLFKLKLPKAVASYSVDWSRIGDYCQRSKLSGRGVKNICLQINSGFLDFEKPSEWYGLSEDEKEKILSKNLAVDEEMILNAATKYAAIEKTEENKVRNNRILQKVSLLEEEMSAHRILEEKAVKPLDLLSFTNYINSRNGNGAGKIIGNNG